MEKELYSIDGLPVFQNRLYDSPEDAINCPRGVMRLVQNLETGMIYNAAFDQNLVAYDAEYQNEQGLSPLFCSHLQQVAGIIEAVMGKSELIEVGCGKGFFLELLLERGADVVGFDATYDGNNPRIQKTYFKPGVIAHPAKGLILRHVLEHIENPVEFLFWLQKANGGDGLIYIEVPCFDWISEKRAWFDIFYEHVNYFRLCDFGRIFEHILASGHLFGDQYMYIIADLNSLRRPTFEKSDAIEFPADFLNGLYSTEQNRTEQNRTEQNRTEQKPVCVWGGASKGVIFSLFRQRAGLPVDIVVDINPAKQKKFLPATGHKVDSPETAMASLPTGATVYVMNSNYIQEIRNMTNNLFNYIGVDE